MTRARHKVQVTFTRDQWELIRKFKDSMGTSDADVVRNVVLAWLSQKSLISTSVKAMLERVGGGE